MKISKTLVAILFFCVGTAHAGNYDNTTMLMLALKMRELEARVTGPARPAIADCASKLDEAKRCYDAACAAPAMTACDTPAVRRIPAARPIVQKVVDAKGCFGMTGADANQCWELLKKDIESDEKAIAAWTDAAIGPENSGTTDGKGGIPKELLNRDVTLKINRVHPHIGTKNFTLEVRAPKGPHVYAPTAFAPVTTTEVATSEGKTIAIWAGLPGGGALVGLGLAALFGPAESGTDSNGNAFFDDGAEWKGAVLGLGAGFIAATAVHFGTRTPTTTVTATPTGRRDLLTVFTW